MASNGGYWTGERFLAQIKIACDIAQSKYPPHSHTVVFILDQSSSNRQFDEKALLARIILVKDGGACCVRDTVWAGKPQPILLPDGSAKGLRTILKDHDINTTLKADDSKTILTHHKGFVTEKTQIEHYVIGREKEFK